MEGRPRKTSDGPRRPHDAIDAKTHIAPHKGIETERIKQRAQKRARHRENFDDGQGQRIADQHIGAELMEVIGHEGRRGGGRAEGREQQPKRSPP